MKPPLGLFAAMLLGLWTILTVAIAVGVTLGIVMQQGDFVAIVVLAVPALGVGLLIVDALEAAWKAGQR